ncbi:alpha/beta hydrolase [Pseudomonas marginalis]|uniref:alpha/beta hydrolase n=1 Tax=Pseudomonas TaxID=286 RepID=UPI003899AE60
MSASTISARLDMHVDVSAVIPLPGPHRVAMTVYLPDVDRLTQPPVAIFASPGGGYTRHYYDMSFAGHAGYSEAEYHCGQGVIFIAYDHLGVGDSSTEHLGAYTVEHLAAANDSAVRQVIELLRNGTLTQGYAALPMLRKVGIGQSMGGCITLVMQGRHATFDAVAALGYSAVHTVLPQRNPEDMKRVITTHNHGREATPADLSVQQASMQSVDFVYPFHWEDVPKDILDADMGSGFPNRLNVPLFGSRTIPPCALAMMSEGFIREEAKLITVPVLMAMGKRDVSQHPQLEPSAFAKACDVSVFVVPSMAHMHNFASTRLTLWARIQRWAMMVTADV